MNITSVFCKFPDQEACIVHLEKVRWANDPHCAHCGPTHVARKDDQDRIGRWNCHRCKSSFNVLSGTIFEKTKIPLQKWFLGIALIVNAKKSLSSCQLARDLDMKQKSAWYMQQRIRTEMASKQGEVLLQGIVEADETYVGGKPRKRNNGDKTEDLPPHNPRGRGTRKTPIVGAVERGGKVVAKVAESLSGKAGLKFVMSALDPDGSTLFTDEFKSYNAVRATMAHATVNHGKGKYVCGDTHVNTMEGFWSLLKRAWYGTHHHYSKRHMSLYVAEACSKYNGRKNKSAFGAFMRGCLA